MSGAIGEPGTIQASSSRTVVPKQRLSFPTHSKVPEHADSAEPVTSEVGGNAAKIYEVECENAFSHPL